ncbi:MAG: TetR/AcrR family transcriptional regulator [Blastocatellia bacterium]
MKPTQAPLNSYDSVENGRLADIYRAAARIICEKGYDATSMNDIAEAIGLTKAGVYHYVPGKKDLLFRIMNFGLDLLDREVIAPARAVPDPEDRLRTIIGNHVRLITGYSTAQGNNPITIVVDEVAGLIPEHRTLINRRKRTYIDLIRDTLRELRDKGKLKEVDVTTATFSLLGMILWLSRWYHPDGRLAPEQIAEETTKIALGGLLRNSCDTRPE